MSPEVGVDVVAMIGTVEALGKRVRTVSGRPVTLPPPAPSSNEINRDSWHNYGTAGGKSYLGQ